MATLEWLNSSHQLQYARDTFHTDLNKMLITLLNNLVAGHMLDSNLDMTELFNLLAVPVMADRTPLGKLNFQPLSNLRSVIVKTTIMSAIGGGAASADIASEALSGLGLQDPSRVPNTDPASYSCLNPNAAAFKPKGKKRKGKENAC